MRTYVLCLFDHCCLLFCHSLVLAEDAIKAALNDYKVKQESKKTAASINN